MKPLFAIFVLLGIACWNVNAQSCGTGGCSIIGKNFPTGTYTPTTSWATLTGMNGGNWTLFNVTCGDTYDWTYCNEYGGSEGWDAQLTLYNYSTSALLCFQDNSELSDCPNAPYLRWTANFSGTIQLLTTVASCQSNTGSPYSTLAYRVYTTGSCSSCTTPGTPTNPIGTQTGQTSANLSWSAGNPVGSSTVTYYWKVSTTPNGNVVVQGSTTGTTASTSSLTCETTYYLTVYASTSCDGSASATVTSSAFTTASCSSGCTTPGTPTNVSGAATGQTSANLSWSGGSPVGSSTVTYYWKVSTTPNGNIVVQGNTPGTTVSTSSLTCETTYYLTVYASTNCGSGSSSGTATSSSFTTSSCSSSGLYGVDISHGNGAINWDTVYAAGKSFAYVKATEGASGYDYTNYFTTTMGSSNPNKVVLGAYHYGRPDDGNTASAEANYFLSIAAPNIGNGYLPPALDLDATPATTYLSNHSAQELAQWVNTWCNTVYDSTKTRPVLYVDRCRANYLVPYYGGIINDSIKLWIADYPTTAGDPSSYTGCGPDWISWPWIFHQYFAPGTAGNDPTTYADPGMDQDFFYGSLTDFNNLIGGSSSPTATITNVTISPSTVCPCGTFTITYTINASASMQLMLGASITPTGTTNYISDSPDDIKLAVPAGTNTQTRSFTVPCGTTTGSFDLLVALWQDVNNDGKIDAGDLLLDSLPETGILTVSNNTPGAVTVNGGGTFCDSAILIATGGSDGIIYFEGMASNGTSTALPANSQTVYQSGTYYFRAYNNCGWGLQGSATVTINNGAGAVTVSGGGSSCDSTILFATGGSNATIYWEGINNSGTSTDTPATSMVVKQSGIYYFRAYNNTCGWGIPGSATVTINSNNSPITVNGGGTFCDSAILNATGGNVGTIYWQGTNSSGTSTDTPSSSQTVYQSGTYYFRTNNICGWTTPGSAVVTIKNGPSVTVTGGGAFCDSAVLSATSENGATIYWESDVYSSKSTSDPTSSRTVTQSGTYYFRAYGNCGWGAPGSAKVTITTVPTFIIDTSGRTSFCENDKVTLSVSPGGTAYKWTGGGTNSTLTVTTSGIYDVTVTDTGGCAGAFPSQNSIKVSVYPNPTANAGNDQPITNGKTDTLGGIDGNFTASGGTKPYKYYWSPYPAGSSSNTIANPTVFGIANNTTYTVTVTDANGCSATSSVTIGYNTIPCTYSISPTESALFPDSGGTGNFTVNVSDTSCEWSIADSCNSWVHITSPTFPYTGSGQVSYVVDSNPNPSTRSCNLSLNSETYTISQSGSSNSSCGPFSDTLYYDPCILAIEPVIPGATYSWYVNTGLLQNDTLRILTPPQAGVYNAIISCPGGQTFTTSNVDVAQSCITGINDPNIIAAFDIHPNPNNGLFIIDYERPATSKIELRIYNAIGQVVYSELPTIQTGKVNKQIDLGLQAKGIYLVQLKSSDTIISRRIIVQ